MKKLLAILFIIFAIGLPCVGPKFFCAHAAEPEAKYYLIDETNCLLVLLFLRFQELNSLSF